MFSVQCYSMLARCCFDVAKSAACHPAWLLSTVSCPFSPFPLLLRHILLPYAGSAFAWPPFFLHSIISNCEQIFQHTHTHGHARGRERDRQPRGPGIVFPHGKDYLFITKFSSFDARLARGKLRAARWKGAKVEGRRGPIRAGHNSRQRDRQADGKKR